MCEGVEGREDGGVPERAGEVWSTGGLTGSDRREAGNSQQDMISRSAGDEASG